MSRHELESTELVIFSPIGDKGDFFGRALASADGIIATSDDAISDTFWFNGISFRSQTPGGEVYLYTFGDAVDNISADSSAYEAALIATIRPPATYWNRGVAEVQGALSVGDGVVVFSGFDHSKINVVENKSVAPLAYVVISDYRGNITNIIHDPNYTDSARQLTPVGYNTERLDLQQGVWVRDYVNNNRTSLWGNQTIVYDKKIYVSDVLGDKIYIYTLEGNLLTTVGIPVSEQGTTDFQGFPEEQMFGYSISINDGILAVGAPNDNNGDSANDGMGSVYLFDTSTLAYLRKIIPSSGIDRGAFGSVVKIGHNRIVVGQPQTQAPFSPTGNIWMFDYDGNFIDNLDTVNNVTNYLGSEQQSSFAITEKYVFVGYAKTGRGQVNVFDTVTGVHQGRMDPRSPLGETSGNYGRSMTIASNGYDQKIIIGNTKSEGKLYYHDLTKREIGTTVKNLSSSSYPGTLDGPTFNSVGYFETDGSSDNITIPGLSLSGTGGFTVELWMKFTGLQSNAGGWNYFLRDEDGLTPPQYEVGVYGNDNYSFIFKQNSISDSVSTVLTQNQWHHICFGVNTSQQLGFIYKDGVYAGGSTNSFSTGVIPLNKLFGNFATNTGLAGQFGEIRGYDDELSGAEVLQNFNATRSKYGV